MSYTHTVRVEEMNDEERAWVVANERLWRRAYAIAAEHPGLDPSGLYHTLVGLELSPEDRLRRALEIGRGMRRAAERGAR